MQCKSFRTKKNTCYNDYFNKYTNVTIIRIGKVIGQRIPNNLDVIIIRLFNVPNIVSNAINQILYDK